MNREEAYNTLKSLIKSENLVKRHLACEAAMRGIYDHLREQKKQLIDKDEEEKWGIVGLLHDADYELTRNHPEVHTLVLEEKLGNKLPSDLMYAIKAHNYKYSHANPKSDLDWAIYCCDELTGLIIAAALIHPDKKLSSLTEDFVMKRFNEPSFAKGAGREQILLCEKSLGITLNDFIFIVLTSMQKISKELGL